ncbi:MAG TPA: hypothetical protein VGR22_05395, partial [Thermomicrobiales bacterium]|nr:hypothetical protein [Thermomicrobiales bacterium]
MEDIISASPWATLVEQLRRGTMSRREFVRLETAAGISVGAASHTARQTGAQATALEAGQATGATSSTGAAEPGGRSINREELDQIIRDTFDLSEPEVIGGQVIYGEISDIDTLNPHLHVDIYSSYLTANMFEYLATT